MDFGNACLFSKKPEDMRRIGALGGRARARNLRLRKVAGQSLVTREFHQPYQETAAEAIRRIDALCPWLGWYGALRGTAAEQMRGLQACARMCFVK